MNPQRIVDMASAFYQSCVLFTASDLGLFNALAERPGLTAEQAAEECGLNARGARLLLDACAALDLVIKTDGAYANAPETSAFLTRQSPHDLSGAIRYNRDVYDAWGRLRELAKTGQPVERPSVHLGDDPERTRAFVLSMHGRAMGIGRAVTPLLELTGAERLLDVGGGPGTYAVLAAQAHPQLSAVVMDLPEVVRIADELIAGQGLSDRVHTMPGDYRATDFPGGMDAVLFFGMLHQESPEEIQTLMRKAYAALNPGGRLYVLDMMTEADHTRPVFSALFAVNMALTTKNGWVFSSDELRGWIEGAGFESFQVAPLPPPMPHWLASAVKV